MKFSRMGLITLFFYHHLTYASSISDDEINKSIFSRIVCDDQTALLNIQVSSFKGFVKLTGVVPTVKKGERVIEIATKTKGVKCLDISRLTLDYGEPLPIQCMIHKFCGIKIFSCSSMSCEKKLCT